jgi:hypothetical protein
MKLPCGCEHDGENYCACGESVCMEHNSDVDDDGEVECERCAKDTNRLKHGQKEVAKLAEMTGANKSGQIVEKIKYLDKLFREGFDDEKEEK